MRHNRVIMLGLAALILTVVASGTASAYSWSSNNGMERSELTSGYAAQWRNTINEDIGVNNGVTLTWGNEWKNNYGTAVYYKYTWNAVYAGRGSSWESSQTLPTGQTSSPAVNAQSGSVNLPYSGFTDCINNNMGYKDPNYSWVNTDFNTNQKFHKN